MSKLEPSKQIEMYDRALQESGSEVSRYVLPAGRTKCIFSDHSIIEVRRGERFCDAARGESPEDLIPKLALRFQPIDPKVVEKIPDGHECDIGFLFSVSFGERANLPPFLAQFSSTGTVPALKGGKALYEFLNAHLDHVYSVTHKPSGKGDRNHGVSVAWVSEPLVKKGVSKVEGKPVKATDQNLDDAFIGTVDLTGDDTDDAPF